jgi:hypothetical protein
VGTPGGRYIPDAERFQEIPEPRPEEVVIIGIYLGRLVAVVHIDGDRGGFNPYRVIQGIGIPLFKKEILVMVAQGFEKPVFRGEAIKNLIEQGPPAFDSPQGIAVEFLNIAV